MFNPLLASFLITIMSVQIGVATADVELSDKQIASSSATTTFEKNAERTATNNVEKFWQAYVLRNGGKYWGRSNEYPPYNEVNEHDTLLIETTSGICLMEFFHSRWRRANDVRRWGERYNAYSGCPSVFE